MKQVIVVNEVLKLPRGKLAAQVAHASVAAFLETEPRDQMAWLEEGMPKVVLKGEDETALRELEQKAATLGLPVCLIEDAGRTAVPEGTVTCLGIGPAEDAKIDEVTGELKLL
ncbi:MAG: peptidyl-tRNA hydrolase [Chloroflexi bacterium]|nr:peptidyl-tRNA hydrolase [Chloroflexota bacterium]